MPNAHFALYKLNNVKVTCEAFVLVWKAADYHCYTISNPKQPSCKKSVRPQKGHSEKRCEIQGGGQEMAVMVG